jgi:transcriptional regulator with XRE-family HTH domain
VKATLERVLARRIRAVAAERGLPLSHLADRAGMARSHLWALTSETRSATLGMVQRLAAVLEVEPLDLLRVPEGPRPTPRRRSTRSAG